MNFDDPNLEANAGLILVGTLVVRLGLGSAHQHNAAPSPAGGRARPGCNLAIYTALVIGGQSWTWKTRPAHSRPARL